MRTIQSTLDDILRREGWPAVTDKASDHGGLTKGGVTFASYNDWLARRGRPSVTREAFPDLAVDEAKAFMLDYIAGPFIGAQAINIDVFAVLFDCAEMSGPDRPVEWLQQSLAAIHLYDGKIDGAYGPKTDAGLRRYLDAYPSRYMINDLVARSLTFYVSIALHDPAVRAFRAGHPTTQLENLDGWVSRRLEFIA